MSEHKATPEQWEVVGLCQEEGKIPWATATCLLELRARVEALEAQVSGLQSCHNTTADHLLDIMAMVRGTASAEAKPAPAGSLVERLRAYSWRRPLQCPSPATIAECGGPCEQAFHFCDCGLLEQLNPELKGPAPAGSLVERVAAAPNDRAKIREVAAWFTTIAPRGSEAWRMASEVLREEAERG
jgi:hypothetical protein